MYRLRKEDSSVYLYLKDLVLSSFIEFQEKDSLIYSASMSNSDYKVFTVDSYLEPSPFSRGRGITYFDDLSNTPLVCSTTYSGTPEQSNRVTLYTDSLAVIPENDYIVDYVDGRVLMLNDTIPSYIDYYWNYVSLVDEWSLVQTSKAPAVVIDINSTKKEGFQLGGGKKVTRKGSLIVFASSAAERKDMIEVLYDGMYLKSCALYDFEEGVVLDYDGTFKGRKSNLDKATNLFSRTTVSGSSNLKFEDVESRHISLPLTDISNNNYPSSINAYRARVDFSLVSYIEG